MNKENNEGEKMSDIQSMIDRIAKNVGCDVTTVTSRMDQVLNEQRSVWTDAGKTEDQCITLALRIAGRQIKTEVDKAKRSGCVVYEGMFLTSPRYKDWAKMGYDKMAKQIENEALWDTTLDLVSQGKLTVFEYDAETNGYIKHYNPSLARKDAFSVGIDQTNVSELPKEAVEVGNGKAFYMIWDSSNPSWDNGRINFKYGKPRPASEKDRTCLFFGRKQGDDDWGVISMKFSGKLAEVDQPTYVPGTIAMRPARNGMVAYAKPALSSFMANDALASQFPADPIAIVKKEATAFLDNGLAGLDAFYNENKDAQDKWDQWVGLVGEVVHIDPRDNGGFIMTVGDLDIMSDAATTDVYVPASQEHLLTFSVGSQVMLVGQVWQNRDEETLLTVQGWWCSDALEPVNVGGWD